MKPSTLRQMAWGERVYLSGREKGLKTAVIFAYFYLERVQGIRLDEGARERMERETGKGIEVVSGGPALLVKRGCGYCIDGGLYCITEAGIDKLVDYGESEAPEIRGKLALFPRPYPAIRGLVPFRGFRPFDGDTFRGDLASRQGDRRPILDSLYYGSVTSEPNDPNESKARLRGDKTPERE